MKTKLRSYYYCPALLHIRSLATNSDMQSRFNIKEYLLYLKIVSGNELLAQHHIEVFPDTDDFDGKE